MARQFGVVSEEMMEVHAVAAFTPLGLGRE